MPIIKDTGGHVNLASRVLYVLEIIDTGLSSVSGLSGIFSEALCFSVFPSGQHHLNTVEMI